MMPVELQKHVLSKQTSSDVDMDAHLDSTLTCTENRTQMQEKGLIPSDKPDLEAIEAQQRDYLDEKVAEMFKALKPSKRLNQYYYHLRRKVSVSSQSILDWQSWSR